MIPEKSNPQLSKQISHIDLNTSTLVNPNEVPTFQASGAKLVPIMEYAYSSQDILKRIHSETHALLAKLENSLSYHSSANPIFEKIEKAFNIYINYVNSVKEKLILKLKKPNLSSSQNLANEFCQFAEEASLANINLKKAVINNDYAEIRKYSLNQTTKNMQEKFNYFVQNLFNQVHQQQSHTGYDVMFKAPYSDADAVLNHVGIALVGFQETTFNNALSISDLSKKAADNLTSPTMHFVRAASPTRPFNANDFANSPTNKFETNRLAIIDSMANVPTKIDPLNTVHKYDKDTKSFFLYSPLFKKKFIIPIPPQLNSIFPLEGCFPSKYWGNNIFFCGGMRGDQVLKQTFLFELNQGRFITRPEMMTPRAFHCLEDADTGVVAIGGKSINQDTNSCERYDAAKDIWEQFPPLNNPRSSAISLSYQSSIYIIGGGPPNQEIAAMEGIKLREGDRTWKIIQINLLPDYSFPFLCANTSELRDGRFLIFGGFTDKNMKFSETSLTRSCVFNLLTNTVEAVIPLVSEYYIITNKSQCINVNGEIVALDERKKIHIFNTQTNIWRVLESNFEHIDFK